MAAPGCVDPSRLTLRCRVCSANRVWIKESSRLDTQRPFSTKISSPGSRPESTWSTLGGKKNTRVDLVLFGGFACQGSPPLKASPLGNTSLTKILLFLLPSMCPVTAKPAKSGQTTARSQKAAKNQRRVRLTHRSRPWCPAFSSSE